MDAYLKAFWLPKEGCTEEEYEDAFFPRNVSSLTGERLRFAVADGATEASFSKLWARLLVRAFVRRSLTLPFTLDELKPLQEQWAEAVHGKELAWYAEVKVASGAFSSLLGLELTENSATDATERQWRAVACGDSCLVQISADQILRSFPLSESAAFTSRPNLLGSLAGAEVDETGLVAECTGTWTADDQFFLMTDALACWFLKQSEFGKKPWSLLKEVETGGQTSFGDFVAELRTNGELKNDDVTLMKIELLPSTPGWD